MISKTDGAVNTYYTTLTIGDDTTYSTQITRIGLPIIPIAFGSMIVVEAVIAVVIYKRFKGRTKKPVKRKADVNLDDLLQGF